MKKVALAIFASILCCAPAMAEPLIMMTPIVTPKADAKEVPGVHPGPNSVLVNGQPMPYEVPSIAIPVPKKDSGKTITMTEKEFEERVMKEASKMTSMQQEMIRPDVRLKDPSNPFDPSVTSSRPRFDQIEDLKRLAGGDGGMLASGPAPVVSRKPKPAQQGGPLVIGPEDDDGDEAPEYFPSRRKSRR